MAVVHIQFSLSSFHCQTLEDNWKSRLKQRRRAVNKVLETAQSLVGDILCHSFIPVLPNQDLPPHLPPLHVLFLPNEAYAAKILTVFWHNQKHPNTVFHSHRSPCISMCSVISEHDGNKDGPPSLLADPGTNIMLTQVSCCFPMNTQQLTSSLQKSFQKWTGLNTCPEEYSIYFCIFYSSHYYWDFHNFQSTKNSF